MLQQQLNEALFTELLVNARNSPRKRAHYNLHPNHSDPVQRLCIGLLQGTYIAPHHHPQANKWEMILVLRGEVMLMLFDDEGVVQQKQLLHTNSTIGIEMTPNTWHTIYPVSKEAIIMEIKEGPYTPTQPEDFASWAPKEGEHDVEVFQQWLATANVGEQYQ